MRVIDAIGLKQALSISAILRDKKTIEQIIDEQPTIEPEPKWIPCSERLPEAGEKNYWVCTDSGYQCQCRWTNTNYFWTELTAKWHWHIMDTPQYSKVIAWMPLPEPFRRE